ncbi:MAG: chemotaxis protein CheV [Deferribacteraceae bacterium]|jgi:two-component system chemotaxis response regulator CheV|nr:chemotaxis protein CheV [Deferribacteraceae bacterium]
MALNHGILLEAGTNEFEIVEFIVESGGKPYHFCINVAKVREVIKFPEVVHVPDAHNSVIGTANIRQNLVPIIDLSSWLGLGTKKKYEDCKVIVTFFNHMSNGFLVDEVVRIHRITWADIRDYSAITDFKMVESVLGVINIQDRMIQLLDFESIVAEINPNTKLTNVTLDMSLYEARRSKTVFVAEDSPVIRRLLAQNFTKAGYKTKAFENGMLLLKAMGDEKPDLVITDLEMPVTSGDYVTRKLREVYDKDSLPIVVFSSMASEENERKLLGLGANQFIGKPELSLLVTIVDDHLLKKGRG